MTNVNPNQAFCFAIAILLLQIIGMQQQQMFAFFILYQRWVIDNTVYASLNQAQRDILDSFQFNI